LLISAAKSLFDRLKRIKGKIKIETDQSVKRNHPIMREDAIVQVIDGKSKPLKKAFLGHNGKHLRD